MVLHTRGQPLRMEERPDPKPAGGEILIRASCANTWPKKPAGCSGGGSRFGPVPYQADSSFGFAQTNGAVDEAHR